MRNLLCFVTVLSTAAVANAADIESKPDTTALINLNPLVVTGTGMPQRLKSSPVAVEVITGSQIKAAGINGLQEALSMMVPNLSFSPNAMGSYLRLNGLTNNHVLILLNGHKLIGDISGNVDLSQIDVNNILRIEVVNGAASTLYGSDAVGGVINIITRSPGNDAEARFSSRYSRNGQFDQNIGLNLAAGKVKSATSYNYSHSDGWQNSGVTEDGGNLIPTLALLSLGHTTQNFSQKFQYEPLSSLNIHAEGSYFNRTNLRPAERTGIVGGTKYNNVSESYGWNGGAEYLLGPLGNIKFDYTGSRYNQSYKYIVPSGDLAPGDYVKTKRQDYHEADLRAVLNLIKGGATVAGATYKNERLVRPESDLDRDLNSASVYIQHEQRLWKYLTAIAGVRYDNYSGLGSRLTPKASIMGSFGNVNVRASYAAGYRTPGIDELYYHMFKPMGSKYTVTYGNVNLKAENSNYYSLNAEYRNTYFSASILGYFNYVNNMVTSSSTKLTAMSESEQAEIYNEFPEAKDVKGSSISVKRYYNFSEAKVRGLEANIAVQPLKDFWISGNYALADGKGLNADDTWQPLNRSIRHTATISGNYTRTWDWYTISLNLNGRIQSKTYYPGDADGDAPGYGVWNFTTRHTIACFDSFTLIPGIGIDNIFNKRDNRPLNKNFALYSPGRSGVVSLTVIL